MRPRPRPRKTAIETADRQYPPAGFNEAAAAAAENVSRCLAATALRICFNEAAAAAAENVRGAGPVYQLTQPLQ